MTPKSPLRNAVERRRGTQQQEQDPPEGEYQQLALRDEQTFWTPRQVAALRQMGIHHASNADLAIYLHYCKTAGLDPFLKQIYLIERRSRVDGQWVYTQTIVVGIDGFRVLAQRAARTEGIHLEYEATIWYDSDGGEHKIWLSTDHPAGAEVTVVKHLPDGTKLRYPGVARFTSYAAMNRQTGELQGQWAVMDDHMIEKCAEAFALRRAFPNDLGGMYVPEEVEERDGPLPPPPQFPAYRRDSEAEDDWVVPGEAGTGPAQEEATPEPEPEPVDKAKEMRRMHAVFRDYGLGGKDNENIRRAVITGLLDEHSIQYARLSEMTPEATQASVMALVEFCKELDARGEDVGRKLMEFGIGIASQIQRAQPGKAEPDGQ